MKRFAVCLNCMDGRAQEPVLKWARQRLGVDFVDMVTEPGVVLQVAGQGMSEALAGKVELSIERHGAGAVIVAAHHDCAANPATEDVQHSQLRQALARIKGRFPGLDAFAVFVGPDWVAHEMA